jgi:hypothetical protein
MAAGNTVFAAAEICHAMGSSILLGSTAVGIVVCSPWWKRVCSTHRSASHLKNTFVEC